MLDKNSEYILWLTKRLVYKYKEDPDIVKTVENILQQNQKELSFYKQTHESIDKFLEASLENLSQIKSTYSVGLKKTESQLTERTIDETNNIFETVDFSSYFE